MKFRKCTKCGWEIGINDPASRCPVCKTLFTEGPCRLCGNFAEYYKPGGGVCRPCYNEKWQKHGKAANAMKQRRRDIYHQWLEKIKQVPPNYPTLSEDQWMDAVRHFGKCALCGNESIDARGYFVPFKDGGRYCDWNMIPVCSDCVMSPRKSYNYFLNKRPQGLNGIVDYLEVRLDKATKWESDK